ncbi:uncharacterized protein LOC112905524 [Agrilus planipennis]|uniref:Uncharacterized protein LOC112905524 n=1 Tax=Agrilus planipennis TaxID=224129 RepID=A0A7F5RD73_AGRPL|nr:uncharacterized protein LOC112905524 [Agrilus planipennis]
MSNKKQPQFVSKPSPSDTGSNTAIPPRYQPPPLPASGTGILKHTAIKDAKLFVPKGQENLKNPSDPANSNKYYPTAVSVKQFHPYPVGGPSQARPNPRTFEEDLRVHSQIHQDLIRNPPQRLDEAGIPQHPQDLRLHQIRAGVRGFTEEDFHRITPGKVSIKIH